MAVKGNQEHLFAVRELSLRLRLGLDELIQLVQAQGFSLQCVDGEWHIQKEDLGPFLREFQVSRGVADQYYDRPLWLKECTTPWAITLNRMYQQPFAYPTAVSPAQGDLLRTLICNIAPQRVVEIGCFIGISTVWMAAGLEQNRSEGLVHTIDLFDAMLPNAPAHYTYIPDRLQLAQQYVSAARMKHRVRFHKGDSKTLSKHIPCLIGGTIDFLFIDGDHTRAGALADFMQFLPHVTVGGYIAFHDIYPEHCRHTGPRYVLDHYVKTLSGLEVVEIRTTPDNLGLALIRKRVP